MQWRNPRRRILRGCPRSMMSSIDNVGPVRYSVAAVGAAFEIGGARNAVAVDYDLRSAGTGTPAIFTLKEPRLVRVQKYMVFQSSPPNATLAVLPKPWTTRPSFLPVGSKI